MSAYHAKKRFGQNFLTDESVADRMATMACQRPNADVIEIGPGQGSLTVRLASAAHTVTAVEFDRDLVPSLQRKFADKANIEIIQADFLKYIPDSQRFPFFVLVGNIPYNITSPLLDWCVRFRQQIEKVVIMVQKELADRVTAAAGNRDWSPLSIFTQLHFDASYAFSVPPTAFRPQPKVTSAVIELIPHRREPETNLELFTRLVRASFKHRRKQLVNNLVPDILPDSSAVRDLLDHSDLPPDCRAEQVSIEQFFKLTHYLATDIIP